HCDVISNHLHKHGPETNMRFSIEPGPGDSGFVQWHSAMRMVAHLSEGIPPEFRRKLWMNLADRHLQSKNVNWIKVERECFSEWSHPADAELGVQIVKDLHRTGCSLFCGEDGQENQALLKRVLLAYARWNKAVGYCQGFNMLAALILQVTEKCETDALKLMIFLIEGVLPESYFADSLRGLSVDMAVFRELLKTRLPRLSRHLDALQTAAKDGTTSYEPPLTNVFTMQWFLTLFCNCLPQPTVLRVWDLILLEGNEILLRTALGIWQVLAERILSVRSADEFYCIMGVLTRELLEFGIIDANSLVKAIVQIGPLTELPALREKYFYNINPWSANVSSNVEAEMRNRQLKLYGRERLALDIGALKKQYSKLKQRQRQAHIIFSAAVARQPSSSSPVVAMNHLLLGKSALITSKRLGPPKGAIPPSRQAQPSTLLWKDAPRQSSSSSSSDTELCDDPENHDENSTTPLSKSPLDSQCVDDNRIESFSDNLDLMKFDNTKDESVLSSDCEHSIKPTSDFDTEEIVNVSEVDNNNTNVIISDIFDTQESTNEGVLFDFGRYGLPSDSDDDSFEFEKFLENRVRCLKHPSVDEESVASSSEDPSEFKTGKKSQRALEIIQENSLILHRILQCQSRLTPSPPASNEDTSENSTVASIHLDSDISYSADTETLEDVKPQFRCPDIYGNDNAEKSIMQSSYETDRIMYSPTASHGDPIDREIQFESALRNSIPSASTQYEEELRYKYKDFSYRPEVSNETVLENEIANIYSPDEIEVRPKFSSILDSEYTRNLEEKYENLIVKSSRPTFLEVTASLSSSCGASKYSTSPINIAGSNSSINKRSPDGSLRKSPVDGSNLARSPNSGRIYNPFPINISSRQSKDVPFRLGLYKKS
ncbi:uncharacterized protein LOC116176090, partial [Photinus pyralis]